MRFLNFHAAILTLVPVLGAWALAGGTTYFMLFDKNETYRFYRNRHGASKTGYFSLKLTSMFIYAMTSTVAYLQGAPAATRWWFEARNRAEIKDY